MIGSMGAFVKTGPGVKKARISTGERPGAMGEESLPEDVWSFGLRIR